MVNYINTKIRCNRCGKETIGGNRAKYCQECKKIKYYEAGYNSSIKRMIRNREFIKNYKKDKKCELCGYNKCTEILDFHHKNKEDKNEGVNRLMKTLRNLDIIKAEIENCLLLCPNCHRELHLKEGPGTNDK